MEEPKRKECKKCGEIIYGLTEKDLKQKMIMHNLKHEKRKHGI